MRLAEVLSWGEPCSSDCRLHFTEKGRASEIEREVGELEEVTVGVEVLEMKRCYSWRTNRSAVIVPVWVDYVNIGFFVASSVGKQANIIFHLQRTGMSCIFWILFSSETRTRETLQLWEREFSVIYIFMTFLTSITFIPGWMEMGVLVMHSVLNTLNFIW